MPSREFESVAVKPVEASKSLRTTIPLPVAAVLGVEEGDVLVWSLDPGAESVSVRVSHPPEKKSSKRR